MKSFLKWGAIIVGCLVVVIIAALVLIPMFVDVQKYKPMLESKVTQATGRPFAVGDDLSLSLFPWAGISFSDLRLGNTAGFTEKDFISVKSFEVRVKLLPLISKDIQIKRLVINEPRIVMVKNENGRVNWEQPKQSAKDAPSKKTPTGEGGIPISALTVGDFSIKNGSALWIDHTTDTRKEIADINLILNDVSLDRPVRLKLSAVIDQKPLSLDGTVGPVGKGFGQGSIPLDLNLNALKQLSMRLKGNLENPATAPGVDVDIAVDEFSPRELVAALGQTFPVTTADSEAINRVALKAHVKAGAKKVSLSNGILDLDQSKLTFSATAADFSRPNLKFDLDLDQINLDRYMPPKPEQTSKKGNTKQTSEEKSPATAESGKKKTDYTPLRRLILDGRLKIGKATVNKAKLRDIYLQVKAKNGIIDLDPVKLNLYQGNASLKANLNVTKDVPKSDINLLVNKVQVGPLLQDVLDKDILEGATQANVTLAMVGDDPELIKKTLNGNGEVVFNDGAIKGIDIAGMVRNVKAAFGLAEKPTKKPQTDFAELKAPFRITNGVVNTPQTTLQSPLVRVTAAGNADLVKETLDFRVEPKAVGTLKGQGDEKQRSGLMVPVVVSGSFSSPKFRPDLSAAAKEEIGKKILESKEAKKILEKKELKVMEKPVKDALKGILGN